MENVAFKTILFVFLLATTGNRINQLLYMRESALMEAVSQGSPESWTWQAALRRPNKQNVFCGAVLVSSAFVLTAAHCVYYMKDFMPTPLIEVIIGEKDLQNQDGLATNVTEVFLHKDYDPNTQDFDFALLRLADPVEESPLQYIHPVKLPSEDLDFESGTVCFVSGYGIPKPGVNTSAKLMIVQVPIASQKACKAVYKDRKITPRMFCAGFEEGGVDACQGDGGGPLVCKDGFSWYLKGLVSWGRGCAVPGSYGVYADVRKVMKWIEETTGLLAH